MGKKGFIYGDSMLSEIKNPYITKSSKSKDNILYPELSWENFNHKCHYNIAEKELGVKNKKTPREIKQIFGWSLSKTVMNLFISDE